MRHLAILLCACLAFARAGAAAAEAAIPDDVIEQMQSADVVILGEVHDNPHHHMIQAQAVEAIQPGAVVWEMLTEEGANRVTQKAISEPEKLAELLKWAESGWPPLAMYLPIFGAAPQAPVYGALVPREAARLAMDRGITTAMGADAARYGLNIPLPAEDQVAREADQMAAHCDALPPEILPQMVAIQRLRDAVLARAIRQAMADTGGPVAVITGNGHARKDRGIPTFLSRMEPGLRVFVLGQSEDGAIPGEYDAVIDSPGVERDDPCAVFEKQD